MAESVYDFHERFDIPQINIFSDDDIDIWNALSSRLALQMEELGEMSRAVSKANWAEACLESGDVLYVALGNVLRLGESGKDVCYSVVEKNDNKTTKNSKIGAGGKITQHA